MVCLFIFGSLELTVPHCAVKCPTNKNKDRSWPNKAPNLGFMFWSLLSSWHFNYYTYKTNLNYLLGQQGSLGTKARKQKTGCGQCLHTSATKIVTRTDHKLDKDVYFHKFCFFTVRFFFFWPTTVKVPQCFEEKLAKQTIHHQTNNCFCILHTKWHALIWLAVFHTTFGS